MLWALVLSLGLFSSIMSREYITIAVDVLHLGRRMMDGWDVGPDRDELKYEVNRCSSILRAIELRLMYQ